MPSREGYYNFPSFIRRQVREEQNNSCAYCGNAGCVEIHHIVPSSQKDSMGWTVQQITARENAVGLCGEEGNNCHKAFDILASDFKTYFEDIMEGEGKKYTIPQAESNLPPVVRLPVTREPARFYQVGDD